MRPASRDRDRVVGDLRTAYSGGVIGLDTFELRVGHALTAGTRLRLRALVADLPLPRRRWTVAALRDALLGRDENLVWIDPPPDIAIGDTLVIGREPGVNLTVEDPAVSRRHLMLRRDDRGWIAVDLQSTNGTYVNGWRIERARLKPGDELQVGDTRVRIRRSAPSR